MASGRLFLGVDGGQSSTKAVIGDVTGRVLGRGKAGPCNHASQDEGRAKLESAISSVVDDALGAAGLPVETGFEAACFGMSGGADDKRNLISEFVRADAIRVVNDAEAALEAAAENDGAAAVVIAGTGCIALARSDTGKVVRCGGWGYLFGDQGGAFGIVRSALQLALAAEERWSAPTKLIDVFCEATGADSANEAMHCLYGPDWPRDRIAGLAPAVDAAAKAGDGDAIEILHNAGSFLANLALGLDGAMLPAWLPNKTHYSGGVFRSVEVLRTFQSRCEEKGRLVAPLKHDGASGALLLAYGLAGVGIRGSDLT